MAVVSSRYEDVTAHTKETGRRIKASPDCIARPCLQNNNKNPKMGKKGEWEQNKKCRGKWKNGVQGNSVKLQRHSV